jgi:hypothetical protein
VPLFSVFRFSVFWFSFFHFSLVSERRRHRHPEKNLPRGYEESIACRTIGYARAARIEIETLDDPSSPARRSRRRVSQDSSPSTKTGKYRRKPALHEESAEPCLGRVPLPHNLDLIFTLTGGLGAALVLGFITQRLRLSPIRDELVSE